MCGILLRGVGNAKNGIVLRKCIRDGTRNNIHNKIPGYILFCFYWELLLRSVLCMFYRISRFLENEGVIFDVNKTKKYLGILLRTHSACHLVHFIFYTAAPKDGYIKKCVAAGTVLRRDL